MIYFASLTLFLNRKKTQKNSDYKSQDKIKVTPIQVHNVSYGKNNNITIKFEGHSRIIAKAMVTDKQKNKNSHKINRTDDLNTKKRML